jgi:hypothetical protein
MGVPSMYNVRRPSPQQPMISPVVVHVEVTRPQACKGVAYRCDITGLADRITYRHPERASGSAATDDGAGIRSNAIQSTTPVFKPGSVVNADV